MRLILTLLCVTLLSAVLAPAVLAEEEPSLTEAEVKALVQSAGKGDAAAQQALAIAYFKGNGVKRDGKLGREWMEKSAAQNHVPALRYLASAHLRESRSFKEDRALSLRYAEKADATNTAEGAFVYGTLIIGGWYKDLINDTHRARAAERLKYAYENGEKGAAAQLAKGYRAGWFGEPANGEKALKWHEAWAETGAYYAHQELARLYDEGELLPRDYQKALHYYTLATNRLAVTQSEGAHNTKLFLSRMYFRMAELNELIQPPNVQAAFDYYSKTVETFDSVDASTARIRFSRIALDHGDAEIVSRAMGMLAERGREGDEAAACLLITVMKEGRNGFPVSPEGVATWTPHFEELVFEGYNVPSKNDAWLDYDLATCKRDAACRSELEQSKQYACNRAYIQKTQ